MKVPVTQKHMDGAGFSCTNCPIARSLRELLPSCYVEVHRVDIRFYRGGSFVRSVATPEAAERFIIRWDLINELGSFELDEPLPDVVPFEFELPGVDDLLQEEGQ